MKKFNFKEYAQSGQLDADAQRAITRAIEQAEAAGLPRAYRTKAADDTDADCTDAQAAQLQTTRQSA
ncbi:hypothetical protein Dxin01_03487 [Deinococcus xinjiangensis]|uniref:Uncharacterized protein n=1 Tax=Deinococcus xinjiangensis TaxID=457454 RepID=A0ABP9VG43_9DEIO